MVGDEITEPDFNKAYDLLKPCADSGHPRAQNLLGMMYLNGDGIEKNEKVGFGYIEKSALQAYPAAEFNLGRLYKEGVGCELDYKKALEWFQVSAEHGNQRGFYSIGYMHMKGLGTGQSYPKAIEFFKKSDYPMAKHWLAYSYYFGYGVEENPEMAMSIMEENKILNSTKFLGHIKNNKKIAIANKIRNELSEKPSDTTSIYKSKVPKKYKKFQKNVKPKKLFGVWRGKLLEYDWSGQQVEKITRVRLKFKKENSNISYIWRQKNEKIKGTVSFSKEQAHFTDLYIELERPYSDQPESDSMFWQVISSTIKLSRVNGDSYLIGNLETYSEEWKEPGPPRTMVLKKIKNGEEIDGWSKTDEILLEEFVRVYPNPMNETFNISYTLEKPEVVTIKIYDFSGVLVKQILTDKAQDKGEHALNIDSSSFRPGTYVLNIQTADKQYQKLIIKN